MAKTNRNERISEVSTYGNWAKQYIEAGYSPIPIMPQSKRPGVKIGNAEPKGLGRWQRLCEAPATDEELNLWSSDRAQAGIGLALGFNNVVAIDIDAQEGPVFDALADLLPDSEWVKMGAKGFTAFFRTEEPMKAQKFKLRMKDGQPYQGEDTAGAGASPVLEILGFGNQTVIPPTVHPGTGEAYRWENEPLSMCPAHALPLLPGDFPQQVKDLLEPWGYRPRSQSHKPGDYQAEPGHASVYAETNADALKDLDCWVPYLDRVEFDDDWKGDGYRMRATWRGGSSTTSVRIDSECIFDYGEDQVISPIDLVIYMNDMTPGEAFGWLFNRVNAEWIAACNEMVQKGIEETEAREREERARYEDQQRQFALAQAAERRAAESAAMGRDEREEVRQEVSDLVAGWQIDGPREALPDIIEASDGLFRDLVDWGYAMSNRDSLACSVAAAVGIMCSLYGRRWASVRAGGLGYTHPNMTMILAVDSGAGKTTTVNRVRKMFEEAMQNVIAGHGMASILASIDLGGEIDDLDEEERLRAKAAQQTIHRLRFVSSGPETFSQAGIVNVMMNAPNSWSMIDECGPIFKGMFQSKPGSNQETLLRAFKALSTESDGSFQPNVYASTRDIAPPIINPSYSVTFSGTPDQVWDNLPPSSYSDGFMGRALVLCETHYAERKPSRNNDNLRASIVSEMTSIINERINAPNDITLGGLTLPDVTPTIIGCHRTTAAEAMLSDWEDWIETQRRRAFFAGRPDTPLWGRLSELTQKISVIHALGKHWRKPKAQRDHNPTIDEDDLKFAIRLARYSIQQVAAHALDASGTTVRHVEETKELTNRIRQKLLSSGGKMTLAALNRAIHLRKDEGQRLIETMTETGELVMSPTGRAGSFVVELVQ